MDETQMSRFMFYTMPLLTRDQVRNISRRTSQSDDLDLALNLILEQLAKSQKTILQ